MKRNFKALGLALVAALAMSAVAASAAQATNEFSADKFPVALTAEQEPDAVNVFTAGENEVTCEVGTFEGTAEGPVTTLTVEAHYTECEVPSLNVSATVHMNSCDFTFDALKHVKTHEFEGQAWVDCATPDDHIVITIPESGGLCDIEIPAQGPLKGVTYTNITNGAGTSDDEVTVDVDITNQITYTENDTSIFCPLEGGEHHDGSYVSEVEVRGYEKTGRHVNGHEETQTHNGTQVGVRVQTP